MRNNPQQPSPMELRNTDPTAPVDLADRPHVAQPPAQRRAALVQRGDLRDGNQALIDPMFLERKDARLP